MPRGMDLVGQGSAPYQASNDAVGIAFAVRAIAVIRVHDSDAAKAKGLTLRQICDAEEYLNGHANTLSAHLFRAFGRNCLPVLQNFLSGAASEEELEAQIRSYVNVLEHNLDLKS